MTTRDQKIGLVALIVVATIGVVTYSKMESTEERVEKEFAKVLAEASHDPPETGLRKLDELLASRDLQRVSSETEQRIGKAVVELSTSLAPSPLTREHLDQVARLVRRYQALPPQARDGVARDAMLAALERWAAVFTRPEDQDAKLALLVHAATVTDAARSADISHHIVETRVLAAQFKATNAPLDALAIAVDSPRDEKCLALATKILESLADKPSLLVEASAELDSWASSLPATDPLRKSLEAQRALGRDAQTAARAPDLDRAKLEALQKQNPWDQYAALEVARLDFVAGKTEAAEARIRALGPSQLIVREGRFLLAQIAIATDKLDEADALFTSLLATRLEKFQSLAAAGDALIAEKQRMVAAQLDAGEVPPDLEQRLRGVAEKDKVVIARQWFSEQVDADPRIKEARAAVGSYTDVVPISIAAGTAKLRRAQKVGGAERDKLLAEAERIFLSVRMAAEGQPGFHLGLGEIYARLGKTKESEAELASVLEKKEPALSLAVVDVYRNIGSVESAKKVAEDVFNTAPSPYKEGAAALLGVLNADDEAVAERWLRKADQTLPFIKTSLLEVEARRALTEGKYAVCASKFAEAAKASLANATDTQVANNNAALAYQYRFYCTGDMSNLADAETILEKAYREQPDQPIVVQNLVELLLGTTDVRVVAKRVDLRRIHLDTDGARRLIDTLVKSSERDKVLADLTGDAAWQRTQQLLEQAEILAPNNLDSYRRELDRAVRLRDVAQATAIMGRVHGAKNLDTTRDAERFRKWMAGELDAKYRATAEAERARYTTALAGNLDAHTRGAANLLLSDAERRLGVLDGKLELITHARLARLEAGKAWPALASPRDIAMLLVDEAGFMADAKTWSAKRRNASSASVLTELAAANDPLAKTVLASSQWAQVGELLRAETTAPDLEYVRLARLLGDAALETRAKAALDDKLLRFELEVAELAAPGVATADLAYYDKR